MRVAVGVALCLVGAQPALACSAYPTRSLQYDADVVVAGNLVTASNSNKQVVVPRRVLKGLKLSAYPIVWPVVSDDDECAFLLPIHLERGVYFLKRREDGSYDVLKTEKRWKMVR